MVFHVFIPAMGCLSYIYFYNCRILCVVHNYMVEFDGKILELTAGLGCVLSNFRRPVIFFPRTCRRTAHHFIKKKNNRVQKKGCAPALSTHMYNTASTSSLTNRRLVH
jgi:hypothetical protein